MTFTLEVTGRFAHKALSDALNGNRKITISNGVDTLVGKLRLAAVTAISSKFCGTFTRYEHVGLRKKKIAARRKTRGKSKRRRSSR